MRKIMFFAVAAIAAVACSKTYNVKSVSEQEIGFSTWAENLTKARAQGASEFVSGDSFNVEGFKTVDGANTTVFDDVEVSTTNGSAWTYEDIRFWDSNASQYTFFAVSSPTTDLNLTFDAEGKIAATAVTFDGKNNDILLADQVDVANADFNKIVNLVFSHIGSLVDLKVKKGSNLETGTLAITKVTLEEIDGTGTVAVTGYTDKKPAVEWAFDAATVNYTNESCVESVTLPTDVKTDGTDYLLNTLVVAPQELADAKILKISYTIKDAAGNVSTYTDKVIPLNQFDKTDNKTNTAEFITAWEAAKHYVYTLTIDANTIVFSGSITDWTTVEGYHYLLN